MARISNVDPFVTGEVSPDGSLTTVKLTDRDKHTITLRLDPFRLKRLAVTLEILAREMEKRQGPISVGVPIEKDGSVRTN